MLIISKYMTYLNLQIIYFHIRWSDISSFALHTYKIATLLLCKNKNCKGGSSSALNLSSTFYFLVKKDYIECYLYFLLFQSLIILLI